MRDLKYIIVALISHPNFKTAIIFNGMINHCDMIPKGYKAVSAGFCTISNGLHWLFIQTYGKSESLGLESRGIDATIIRKTLERSIDMMDMDDPTEQNPSISDKAQEIAREIMTENIEPDRKVKEYDVWIDKGIDFTKGPMSGKDINLPDEDGHWNK